MAEERVQRRLAAILAADVVGYSRLMEADEEGQECSAVDTQQRTIEIFGHGPKIDVTVDAPTIEARRMVDALIVAGA